MSLQHIQKKSPRLLPKPAKFEKNPPNGYRVIRKTKCGAGSSPIHKQASLAGRLMNKLQRPNSKHHQTNWQKIILNLAKIKYFLNYLVFVIENNVIPLINLDIQIPSVLDCLDNKFQVVLSVISLSYTKNKQKKDIQTDCQNILVFACASPKLFQLLVKKMRLKLYLTIDKKFEENIIP